MERDYNRHHIFYPRRKYKSSTEREFRNYSGFVVPTWIPAHKLLHVEVPAPPKPSAGLMREILYNLQDREVEDRLDGLFYTVEFLADRGEDRLATNLTKQLGYLQMRGVEDGDFKI